MKLTAEKIADAVYKLAETERQSAIEDILIDLRDCLKQGPGEGDLDKLRRLIRVTGVAPEMELVTSGTARATRPSIPERQQRYRATARPQRPGTPQTSGSIP